MVPIPLPGAVRSLHGTFHSLGALILVLQELGGRDKQEEHSSCGAGNEEASSTGQLQPGLNPDNSLAGQEHPCFALASPGLGPSLGAGSMGRGGCSPTPWDQSPLPGLCKLWDQESFSPAHPTRGRIIPQPNPDPSAFPSDAEVGERRRHGKDGGEDGEGPPSSPVSTHPSLGTGFNERRVTEGPTYPAAPSTAAGLGT